MLTTPVLLSGSTSGRPIKVVATSTAGTLIHTAVAGATSFDEVSLWCQNTDTSDRKLTLELGGVTSPDDLIEITIPTEAGLVLVLDAARFNGGGVIGAFAASANVLTIVGVVNRMVP